jgi:[ribosomal protein S18]-alanine N-acetyltransferase
VPEDRRAMTPDALAALHARCFITPRPWSQADFESMLGLDGVFVLLAPGGLLLGRTVLDEAELLTLAVDPAQRRHGLGRGLVTRFAAAASQRGAARGYLEVAADNAAAIALYRSAGWQDSGRRKGYYRAPDGRGVDALLMSCAFAQGPADSP